MSTRCWMTGIVVSSCGWWPRCGALGFLLRLLAGERGDLGAVLRHLIEQKRALGADQYRVCFGRRREVGRRIVPARQRRAQPHDVELLGQKVVAQWSRSAAFTVGSSSISTSPALTACPSCTRMERTTPVSNGW